MSWTAVAGKGGGEIVKLGEGEGRVDEVIGVYLDVEHGEYGPLYALETEGGKIIKVPGNKDLDNKLDPALMLEKLVRIKYEGLKPLKGGKTLKLFSVSAYTGEITKKLQEKYPSLKPPAPAKAAGFDEVPAALAEAEDDDGLGF